MGAEVDEDLAIQQGGRRRRDEDLVAMREGRDARSAMHVGADVPSAVSVGTPVCRPMRTRIAARRPGLRLARGGDGASALGKATKKASPWVSISSPLWAVKAARSTSVLGQHMGIPLGADCWSSRVEPSMSVNRKVTVPVGRSCTTSRGCEAAAYRSMRGSSCWRLGPPLGVFGQAVAELVRGWEERPGREAVRGCSWSAAGRIGQ